MNNSDDPLAEYRRRMKERWAREHPEETTSSQPSEPVQQNIEHMDSNDGNDEVEEITSAQFYDSGSDSDVDQIINVSQLQEDEELARKLQEEYDKEYQETLQEQEPAEQIPITRTSQLHRQGYQTSEPNYTPGPPRDEYADRLSPDESNYTFPRNMFGNSPFISSSTMSGNVPGANQFTTETRNNDRLAHNFFNDDLFNNDIFSSFDRDFEQMRQRMFGGRMFRNLSSNNSRTQ